ncbi:hypothetical protein HOY80DRAFT_967122 [Tuber brumale]|nr:hypothetical protein HOY80DRAFT_967122 [Tuber brumale]
MISPLSLECMIFPPPLLLVVVQSASPITRLMKHNSNQQCLGTPGSTGRVSTYCYRAIRSCGGGLTNLRDPPNHPVSCHRFAH